MLTAEEKKKKKKEKKKLIITEHFDECKVLHIDLHIRCKVLADSLFAILFDAIVFPSLKLISQTFS